LFIIPAAILAEPEFSAPEIVLAPVVLYTAITIKSGDDDMFERHLAVVIRAQTLQGFRGFNKVIQQDIQN